MVFSFVDQKTDHTEKIPERIALLEKEFNICFPRILKEYYLAYDGCLITPCDIEKNGYHCELNRMVSLCSDSMNFEIVMKNDRDDGFISPTFCPIGMNQGGDFFYWDSITENVYLVLSDDIENPFKLCDSVKDLFQMMNDSVIEKQKG